MILAFAVGAISVSAATAAAIGDDTVVVRADARVQQIHALGGVVLFQAGRGRPLPTTRNWFRVVDGHVRRVEGVPDTALGTFDAIGRDRRGRIVVTLQTGSGWRGGRLRGARWWSYDVMADRSRPLTAVAPGACAPLQVSIWRARIAYSGAVGGERCSKARKGIRLLERGRVRTVSRIGVADTPVSILLRGDTVVAFAGKYPTDMASLRLVHAGRRECAEEFTPSESDQTEDDNFRVRDAWLRGRDLVWWMDSAVGSDVLLAAPIGVGCTAPGPTGSFDPVQRPERGPLAVDGETLYVGDRKTLLRRALPATASTAVPVNDTIASAEQLAGALPMTVAARVGYATHTEDEPLVPGYGPSGLATAKPASRTTWYRYTPTESGPLYVWATQWTRLAGGLPVGAFALFRGPKHTPVTELPHPFRNDVDYDVVDAVAGEEILIGLGCDAPGACFPAFELSVSRYPPFCDATYCPPDGEAAAIEE
jgi:hypothetical protein